MTAVQKPAVVVKLVGLKAEQLIAVLKKRTGAVPMSQPDGSGAGIPEMP